jgi:hypothetical protein
MDTVMDRSWLLFSGTADTVARMTSGNNIHSPVHVITVLTPTTIKTYTAHLESRTVTDYGVRLLRPTQWSRQSMMLRLVCPSWMVLLSGFQKGKCSRTKCSYIIHSTAPDIMCTKEARDSPALKMLGQPQATKRMDLGC